MAKWIDISFRASAGVHRIRNFAEELSLALESSGLGVLPMSDADTAEAYLRVTAIKQNDLRRCLSLARQLLDKHHMTTEATLSPGGDAS